jgi:zinc protease
MKTLLLVSLLLCLPVVGLAQAKKGAPKKKATPAAAAANQRKIFPYAYTIDDLPNGLRLVTVPTDYPNLVALYIVVQTGSRNEIEPGKSGYAHFFEHMMFRGSKNVTPAQRDNILKRAGASANAYTTDDRTVYHEVFSKEDLDEVMRIEGDRFQSLQYAEPEYKTEALAVLGEYNKNSASPGSKLFEKLRETAFRTHTYSHTTMGFIKDIEDMPNQYQYSLDFYKRYYRPEYATIVVVGDVTRQRALALTRQHFGSWERGAYKPEIPAEPAQTEPREAHVEWPSATLPYMAVAFRAPAYSDESKDKVALDLLAAIAFGSNSELYQRLVLKEQKVDGIGVSFGDKADPELFTVQARIKQAQDMPYVREQILATFRRYTTELVPQQKLDDTRSRRRYGFAQAMDSSEAIAGALAPYLALRRTPETMNKLFALADTVTPADIRDAARRYFTDNNRTIVTLSQGAGKQATNKEGGK